MIECGVPCPESQLTEWLAINLKPPIWILHEAHVRESIFARLMCTFSHTPSLPSARIDSSQITPNRSLFRRRVLKRNTLIYIKCNWIFSPPNVWVCVFIMNVHWWLSVPSKTKRISAIERQMCETMSTRWLFNQCCFRVLFYANWFKHFDFKRISLMKSIASLHLLWMHSCS